MDAKAAAPLNPTWLAALCVVVVVASLVWQGWDMFATRHRSLLMGSDDSFHYFWLPSVVIDHDLDFTNQVMQSEVFGAELRHYALTLPPTATGLPPIKYPPGWAIGSLPFFLLAHSVAPAGATGLEPIYVTAVWCGQLLYAALGLWLASLILARYFPVSVARTAVLVGWLASPQIYYQTVRLAMSHSQVFTLGVAVFWLSLVIHDRKARTWHWGLLGFCAALLVVTRNVAAIYLLLPGYIVAPHLRSFRVVAALVLGAAPPLLVQLGAWKIMFGSWLVYSYGKERFDFTQLHQLDVLFSSRHGWFYWHPLLLPAVGAFAFWARRQIAGRIWLGSLVLNTVLYGAWPTWWLGLSFGHRGFELATFFAMIGLAWLIEATQNRRGAHRGLQTVFVTAIVWNLLLFALFIPHKIPGEDAVTYRDILKALGNWIGLTAH
jgi:hypothetical protein